jgi:SAM-dependent methyltransferase
MFTPPKYILAPYVPTPIEVVEHMVRIAGVQASDTAYDLGCGDGRVLIHSAATCGARGVGVDIEPYWVEQSRLNAALAGVSELVQFECRDALEVDLAPATVVFLYLVHWSTQLVASHLLNRVRPGTRIVSHGFPIEAFPTATDSFVDATGTPRRVFLWKT